MGTLPAHFRRTAGVLGGAQLAWREEAWEARRRLRAALGPTAQAAVAAGLAWLVAHDLLGHAQPFFAPIAAAIALSSNNIRRGRRIAQMVVGVTLGIGVGEAAAQLAGTSAIAIGVVVLVTMALALLGGFGIFSEGMMFVNQSVASAILVVALHRHGTGAERLVDALVGGAIAGVIGVGLFPADPLAVIRAAEREVLRSLAGALARIAELLPTGTPPESGWTLAAAQDVHRQLAALEQARATARASARIAPRRWRLRSEVRTEDARISHFDLLANAALSLFRAATGALDMGETVPASLCEAVQELADVLVSLVGTRQPWPAPLLADTSSRVAALIDAVTPAVGPRAPVLASLVRSTGRDLLRILPPAG